MKASLQHTPPLSGLEALCHSVLSAVKAAVKSRSFTSTPGDFNESRGHAIWVNYNDSLSLIKEFVGGVPSKYPPFLVMVGSGRFFRIVCSDGIMIVDL